MNTYAAACLDVKPPAKLVTDGKVKPTKLKTLAVINERRSSASPDVATVAETGTTLQWKPFYVSPGLAS
jgi:hypothetical protein